MPFGRNFSVRYLTARSLRVQIESPMAFKKDRFVIMSKGVRFENVFVRNALLGILYEGTMV